MKVFYSEKYGAAGINFDTFGKSRTVAELLSDPGIEILEPAALTTKQVLRAHTFEYVDALKTGTPNHLATSQGLGWTPALYETVRVSSGGVLQAANTALTTGGAAGSLSSGLHHARANRGQGFCTLNGLAITALVLADRGYRTLILDFDAHCGGGTAELIAGNPLISQVDVSVHTYDEYEAGKRTHLFITDSDSYMSTISRALEVASDGPTFDIVLYNAGMDVHEQAGGVDGITTAIVEAREEETFRWLMDHNLPVAWVLAGGYSSGAFPVEKVAALHLLTAKAAQHMQEVRLQSMKSEGERQ